MEFFKENFRNKIKKTRESGRESFYDLLRQLSFDFVEFLGIVGAVFANEINQRHTTANKIFTCQGNNSGNVFANKSADFVTFFICHEKTVSLFYLTVRNMINNGDATFEISIPDKILIISTETD